MKKSQVVITKQSLKPARSTRSQNRPTANAIPRRIMISIKRLAMLQSSGLYSRMKSISPRQRRICTEPSV